MTDFLDFAMRYNICISMPLSPVCVRLVTIYQQLIKKIWTQKFILKFSYALLISSKAKKFLCVSANSSPTFYQFYPTPKMRNEIRNIEISQVVEPPNPMRVDIPLESLTDLVESIRLNGLINPITVRPVGHTFEVVAGHRRIIACRIAGLATIPCVVREIDDDIAFSITAAENLERKDTDPVEEALFIGKFVGEDTSKIPDVAKKLNRSVKWVQDRLAILSFPDYMIASIRAGKLSLGVAGWLALIDDDTYRKMYVNTAVLNGMRISDAEYYFNLWACGALQPLNKIDAPQAPDSTQPPEPFSVTCAKCGSVAIEPNFVSVFIHKDCPAGKTDDVAAGAAK